MLAWQATQSLTAGHIQAPPGVSSTAGQLQAPSLTDNDSSSSSTAAAGHSKGGSGSSGGGAGRSMKSLTADVLMLAVGNSRQMGRRVKVRAMFCCVGGLLCGVCAAWLSLLKISLI
jgi:hypothetical protein